MRLRDRHNCAFLDINLYARPYLFLKQRQRNSYGERLLARSDTPNSRTNAPPRPLACQAGKKSMAVTAASFVVAIVPVTRYSSNDNNENRRNNHFLPKSTQLSIDVIITSGMLRDVTG